MIICHNLCEHKIYFEMDNYGQIEIYNKLFESLDESTIIGNAYNCLINKTSYCGIFNGKELPIMVGSKFDKGPNPLKIKGYFVIDGICKYINNIKFYQKVGYTKDRAYLTDGSKIIIEDMFTLNKISKGKQTKWTLPLNWIKMLKYSKNRKRLKEHLNFLESRENVIKNEVDLITLCYMFDCWLGLRKPLSETWRLITAGEILYDTIVNDKFGDPIKCFKTNTWKVKYINDVNTVSENMKHYNYYSDIENIRRVSIATNRERTSKEHRMVKIEEKGIFCPIQTPDGQICGTVNYLVKGAHVSTDKIELNIEKGNDIHIFINCRYKGLVDIIFIDKLKENKYIVKIEDKICYAFNDYGYVIPSNEILSYTASKFKYIYHNPPIRAMFVTSMYKQAIMYDDRGISEIIENVKFLKNNISFKNNVAIMPWYGYNIEDSIVISKKLAEKYKYYKNKFYESKEIILLDIYVNDKDYVYKNQKLYRIYNKNEIQTINIIKAEDEGYITNLNYNDNYIKIVITKSCNLKVGDKMTSMHGQKGVISLIEKDMPYYYENDIKKEIDILINPHAFPSRMTMGQIREMGNKEYDVYIKDRKIKNKIIVGECEYLALRHQVDDKMQYSINEEHDLITRQSINGLRFGQMERDILLALNSWNILKELWNTDLINVKYNKETGRFCEGNDTIKINQYFIICLSIVKALGYDILMKNNKYKIGLVNNLCESNTKQFGDLDVSDVRKYGNYRLLPIALRNIRINELYRKISKTIFDNELNKKIEKEYYKLLRSKNGYFHKYFEGHKVNKCIRSVITPNPKLPIDTVEIPINTDYKYGILNRQPSLNVDSLKFVNLIQGKNKTISFNPLLCKSFNADFDGDEMNIYIIEKPESIKEAKEKLVIKPNKTQDYILGELNDVTEMGLTANKKGFKLMIESGSKGKDFNYEYCFNKIGKVGENYINENYYNGISRENWYILTISAREHALSISLNTPLTGHLQSLVIQSLI